MRAHQQKFPTDGPRQSPGLLAVCALLRIAVVLHRARTTAPLPPFSVRINASRREIKLVFPGNWLRDHPLTGLDLEQEADYLAAVPLRLTVEGH